MENFATLTNLLTEPNFGAIPHVLNHKLPPNLTFACLSRRQHIHSQLLPSSPLLSASTATIITASSITSFTTAFGITIFTTASSAINSSSSPSPLSSLLTSHSHQNAWHLKAPEEAFLRLYVAAVKGGDCVSTLSPRHLEANSAFQGVAPRSLGDVSDPSLVRQMDPRWHSRAIPRASEI